MSSNKLAGLGEWSTDRDGRDNLIELYSTLKAEIILIVDVVAVSRLKWFSSVFQLSGIGWS